MSDTNRQFVQRTVLAVVVFMLVACAWLAPLDSAATAQIKAHVDKFCDGTRTQCRYFSGTGY